MSNCPARKGESKEPARIAQRHRARSVCLENAHTGPMGRRGALTEFVKSVCCAIWVEQGSSTRVPLCADQARIEQRSKQIAKRGGRKQCLLVGESLHAEFGLFMSQFMPSGLKRYTQFPQPKNLGTVDARHPRAHTPSNRFAVPTATRPHTTHSFEPPQLSPNADARTHHTTMHPADIVPLLAAARPKGSAATCHTQQGTGHRTRHARHPETR